MNVTGDWIKVQCCKEQYYTWARKVKSMNHSKSAVVKQEMATVYINILEISELKWTEMGEFNSDDLYICYYGQESLRRNIVLRVNKTVWNAVLGYNLKNDRMTLVHFQGKPFNLTVVQIYATITNAEEAEVDWFDQSRLSGVNTKKKRHYFACKCPYSQSYGFLIGMYGCDFEQFALETNHYHSIIFEIAPTNCILDSYWLWGLLHLF